jgi:hypothetical protein
MYQRVDRPVPEIREGRQQGGAPIARTSKLVFCAQRLAGKFEGWFVAYDFKVDGPEDEVIRTRGARFRRVLICGILGREIMGFEQAEREGPRVPVARNASNGKCTFAAGGVGTNASENNLNLSTGRTRNRNMN